MCGVSEQAPTKILPFQMHGYIISNALVLYGARLISACALDYMSVADARRAFISVYFDIGLRSRDTNFSAHY